MFLFSSVVLDYLGVFHYSGRNNCVILFKQTFDYAKGLILFESAIKSWYADWVVERSERQTNQTSVFVLT